MNIERKLLLNLALRLRWARQSEHLFIDFKNASSQEVEWVKGEFVGAHREAHNSFQEAKYIYNESLKDE